MTHRYILGLGSNLGNREKYLEEAILLLKEELTILDQTSPMETEPILYPNQNFFLNLELLIETEKMPLELLNLLKSCEQKLGRQKRQRYGPREIDIDILWWSGGVFQNEVLQIPHPYLRVRYWWRRALTHWLSKEIDLETGLFYRVMATRPIRRVQDFIIKKEAKEKICMVTCYDYTFARLLSRTSIDCVLVGDSLGNVVQGHKNTLSVTLDDMIYHTRAVRRALPDAFLISDLPFLSYQTSQKDAIVAAGRLVKEGGCDAVKLEGGSYFAETIRSLVSIGIPVMGHLGLTPQWILTLGGYRLQAKDEKAAQKLLEEALLLQEAGIFSLVLEMVPQEVAFRCAQNLKIPVIGIGAGKDVDGQVLVLSDLLGLDLDFKPRFVRNFGHLGQEVIRAVEQYNAAVREGSFPASEESFSTEISS